MNNNNERHLLLWVDVETTTTDPAKGQLLEIGLRLTDPRGEHVVDATSIVVHHDRIPVTFDTLWAVEKHAANGLLRESLTSRTSLMAALNMVGDFVAGHSDATLHPAGTNVDFDLGWIRYHANKVMSGFDPFDGVSYRKLDMSSIRLTRMVAGEDPYHDHEQERHRVDDCIGRDIREWRAWLAR